MGEEYFRLEQSLKDKCGGKELSQQKILNRFLKNQEREGSKKPLILFADIDGTLVNHDMEVSTKDRQAMDHFMAQGNLFSLATGRGRTNAEYYMHSVPSNFPAIFGNGAILYDRNSDEVIREHKMSTEGLGGLVDVMKKFYPDIMVQIYTKDDIFLVTDNDATDPRVANHHPHVRAQLSDLEGMECSKVLFGMEEDNCDQGRAIAWSYVKEHLPDLRVVKSQSIYLELTPDGVSKGEMIRFVREHTDATIAVAGDYFNDLEMLEEADIAYTLQSSPKEVQDAADRILDSSPGEFISLVIADLLKETEGS